MVRPSIPSPTSIAVSAQSSFYRSIALLAGLYVAFGILAWLNATLIPVLKVACDLTSHTQAALVMIGFPAAQVCLGLPAGFLLGKMGLERGVSLAAVTMAVGALLFVPAALTRSFGLFVLGIFVQAAGLTLAQTAANPIISSLGPAPSAARRFGLMGFCQKVAGIVGPLFLSGVVLRGAAALEQRLEDIGDEQVRLDVLQALADRAIVPYAAMAALLVLLALTIRRSSLPATEIESATRRQAARSSGLLARSHLLLAALGLFLCVGAEAMVGEAMGSDERLRLYAVAATMFGSLAAILVIPRILGPETALMLSALAGLALALVWHVTRGRHGLDLLALMGLATALSSPIIIALAMRGLGRHATLGSGLLIMGVGGGGVIPQVVERLLRRKLYVPAHRSFMVVLLACYGCLFVYGLVSRWRVSRTNRQR